MQSHGKKKNVKEEGDLTYLKELLDGRSDLKKNYELVKIMPDDYFAWIELKKALLKDKSLLNLHYQVNTEALITNCKSYPAWNYRLFLTTISVDLEKEDFLTQKLLFSDKRNFHCWNYRRRLNLPKILDYFNYSCLHDLVFKNELPPIENIIYTNPYYEGCLYLFDKSDYEIYLKKYENKIVLHFKTPFTGKITVNNKTINVNLPVLLVKLEEDSFKNIFIDDRKYYLKKECRNFSFIDELLSLEEECTFLLLMKLKITQEKEERRKIIDKLKMIDPLRKVFYETFFNSFYELFVLTE